MCIEVIEMATDCFKKKGESFCCVYSRGGAQSEVRKLHVENVIHWQVSVKGVYRRAIQQLLQVASPRCCSRSGRETRVTAPQTLVPFRLLLGFLSRLDRLTDNVDIGLCIARLSVHLHFLLLFACFNVVSVPHLITFFPFCMEFVA